MSIVTQVEGSIVPSTSHSMKTLLPSSFEGDGFFVIGTMYERARTHSIKDKKATHRFVALPLVVSFIRGRHFDSKGKEVDTQLYSHTELRSKGFLTVERSAKIDPHEFTLSEFVDDAIEPNRAWALPAVGARVTFLAPADQFRHAMPEPNEVVRLNTRGNSTMVQNMTRMLANGEFQHYAGTPVGASYAGNVAERRQLADANARGKALPGQDKQGVDNDDEWEKGGDYMGGDN